MDVEAEQSQSSTIFRSRGAGPRNSGYFRDVVIFHEGSEITPRPGSAQIIPLYYEYIDEAARVAVAVLPYCKILRVRQVLSET